jgi:putative queuosine salvage protein
MCSIVIMLDQAKILNSLKFVTDNSKFVSIDIKAINSYVKDFQYSKINYDWTEKLPFKFYQFQTDEDLLDFLFLISNQAFCFWGSPKWTLTYKKQKLDGWWALLAAFQNALESGVPIFEGEFLAKLTNSQAKKLFYGKPEIPLFDERIKMLRKIGQTLVKKYKGRFYNFYNKIEKDALILQEKISKEFSGFNDVSRYKGKKVYFFKKTQIFISFVSQMLDKSKWDQISNMNLLFGHADYKLPMVLEKLDILKYTKNLKQKIQNEIEIPAQSQEEIEIRANMLICLHLISQKLKSKFPEMNPTILSHILWNQSQNRKPHEKYHLTKTTDY